MLDRAFWRHWDKFDVFQINIQSESYKNSVLRLAFSVRFLFPARKLFSNSIKLSNSLGGTISNTR